MHRTRTPPAAARHEWLRVRLARWSAGLALVNVAIGVFVLIGWIAGSRTMTAILPHMATMKPPTAIGFILAGGALWLRVSVLTRERRWAVLLSHLLAAANIALWLTVLLQFALHRDLGLSLAIARIFTDHAHMDPIRNPAVWSPVMSPAPATAAGFICVSLAINTIDALPRARIRPPEVLATGAVLIGLTALLVFIFDIEELYRNQPYTSLALHTAVGMVLLGIGVFLARVGGGATAILIADNAGGSMARVLLPATLAGPIIFAGLGLAGERMGLYGSNVRSVLLAISNSVVLSCAVIITAWVLARTDDARRRGEARQSLMMAELDHRVKNTLAAILSLSDLTIMSSGSLEKFSETFSGRLRAMARTHEALAAARWEGVHLHEVIRLTVAPLADKRLSIEGTDLLLPSRASSSLCLALHELTTNAAKYGALKAPAGRIRISWSLGPDNTLAMEWQETGLSDLAPPATPGFGTQLIEGALAHELGGTVRLTFAPPGLACTMSIPLDPLRDEPTALVGARA